MTLYQSKVFTPREQSKNVFTPRNEEELDVHIDYTGEKLSKKKKSSPLTKLKDQAMTSRNQYRNSQMIDKQASWYGESVYSKKLQIN
jgi:hypothetical protein